MSRYFTMPEVWLQQPSGPAAALSGAAQGFQTAYGIAESRKQRQFQRQIAAQQLEMEAQRNQMAQRQHEEQIGAGLAEHGYTTEPSSVDVPMGALAAPGSFDPAIGSFRVVQPPSTTIGGQSYYFHPQMLPLYMNATVRERIANENNQTKRDIASQNNQTRTAIAGGNVQQRNRAVDVRAATTERGQDFANAYHQGMLDAYGARTAQSGQNAVLGGAARISAGTFGETSPMQAATQLSGIRQYLGTQSAAQGQALPALTPGQKTRASKDPGFRAFLTGQGYLDRDFQP